MEFEPLVLILALIIIDYTTGIISSIVNKCFDSSKMRIGLLHKLSYAVAIAVAIIVQQLGNYYDLGYVYSDAMLTLVLIWIIITEVGSILENIITINPGLSSNSFLAIFDRREKKEEEEKEVKGKHAIDNDQRV